LDKGLDDGTESRLVETSWRSTQLPTMFRNIVALPNSVLAKLGLTNITSPDEKPRPFARRQVRVDEDACHCRGRDAHDRVELQPDIPEKL
jgi:hypothetical protein